MQKVYRFGKILITDVLGVLCLLAALATGWLPGPGGIPLFILGLSLLAIHHKWARQLMLVVRRHAHRLGEVIFIENQAVQWAFDLAAVVMIGAASVLFWKHQSFWQIPLGTFLLFLGITIFLGNRRRWPKVRSFLKRDIG